MAEPQRQSSLAHESAHEAAHADAAEPGVTLLELPLRAMVALRGDAADPAFAAAVRQATGCDLPAACRAEMSAAAAVLWMGPDEWLVVGHPDTRTELAPRLRSFLCEAMDDALREAQGDGHAAVTEVGEALTVIGLGGRRACDLLAKGCTIDLHPRAFGAGQCVNTLLAKAQVTLHQIDDAPTYSLYVQRSFAVYLWRWILDAGLEYGAAVNKI